MRLFQGSERRFARAIADLAYTNPFLPARIEAERAALGSEYQDAAPVWHADDEQLVTPQGRSWRHNVARLRERSWRSATQARDRLVKGGVRAEAADLVLYRDLCLYALFARYETALYRPSSDESAQPARIDWYREWAADFARYFRVPGVELPAPAAEHALALGFQIRRAFHYVFRHIFGSSLPVAQLRAETWHSIFTHDLRRYQAGLYLRMHDLPTLVVGASGTGKDLVAQAIGYSRYVPFDPRRLSFTEAYAKEYHPLNLAALPASLLESELFGHRRGAFTGAFEDRSGWFEACGPAGTVFLDEIGDLEPAVQVKLLRVLQSRVFHRVGETGPRAFLGKLVAATNRDLGAATAAGHFRADLYYRLCADRIATPTLSQRIAADPGELDALVLLLARRLAGSELAASLADEVVTYIDRQLGRDYGWPGNVRELEQCVRSVLVRRAYVPLGAETSPLRTLDELLEGSQLTAEQLLDRYAGVIFRQTGSYSETARRLRLDRRTVKERVARSGGP